MRDTAHQLLQGCASWEDVCSALEKSNTKTKGDAFELLVKRFLETSSDYSTRLSNVWLLEEVPYELLTSLNLPSQDMGIDLIARSVEGDYWAIQCKYREKTNSSIGWGEVSTFTGLIFGSNCKGITHGLICTTTERYTDIVRDNSKIGVITNETWQNLTTDFFSNFASNKKPEASPKIPRQYQKEAVSQIIQYFSTPQHRRGKVIMPCGTGKSLISYWAAMELNVHTILVVVPSLGLLRQTISVWTQEFLTIEKSQRPQWTCICSDENIGNVDLEESITQPEDLGYPYCSNVKELSDWLSQTKLQKVNCRVVFTTYQSGPKVSDACEAASSVIDLAILDEAHRTAGQDNSLFANLLSDKNITITKRLFMTATERRYSGTRNNIVGMEDTHIYGDTAYYMSFKAALEQGIIADYKIITLFISQKEISDFVTNNNFIRTTDQGIWSSEIEAEALASLVALRKAIHKYSIRHTVSYHSSIERAKNFKAHSDHLSKSYGGFGPLTAYHVAGTLPAGVRHRILRDFVKSEVSLVTNARCLTEGIDLPEIDCILFADPKRSAVDIVQAVGRALRPELNKKCSYVLVPVVVNDIETLDDIWGNDMFRSMLSVIQALASSDERVIDYFRGRANGRISAANPLEYYASEAIKSNVVELENFISSIDLYCWDNLTKLMYRSFSSARIYIRSLHIEDKEAWVFYCSYGLNGVEDKPHNIPEHPDEVYKDNWVGWNDWLGSKPLRRYMKFGLARQVVRKLGLKSEKEWTQYMLQAQRIRSKFIPTNPALIYHDHWQGWEHWLGVEARLGVEDIISNRSPVRSNSNYLEFKYARDFARSRLLKDERDWLRHIALPGIDKRLVEYKIPVRPDKIYVKDWKGWDDWLHGPVYLPFEESRQFVRSLKLANKKEWAMYRNGRMSWLSPKPDNIPYSPTNAYIGSWVGWRDWLYELETQPTAFNVARAYVRSRKLKNFNEWLLYRDGKLPIHDAMPESIPKYPDLVYKSEWSGWNDWLGISYLPYIEARRFINKLRLRNPDEWTRYKMGLIKGLPPLPRNIPTNPMKYYAKEWQGLRSWCGNAFRYKDSRKPVEKLTRSEIVRNKYMKSSDDTATNGPE